MINNVLAVRGPNRSALADALGLGQVAHVAMFGRDGEDIAARLEQRPFAAGRKPKRLDPFVHRLEVGASIRLVIQKLNSDFAALSSGRIEDVKIAAVFIDDAAFAATGPEHVVLVMMGHFAHCFGCQVVFVEVQLVVPIGGKIDSVADPHGKVVGDIVVGDALGFVGGEIVEPNLLRPSAAIAFPGAKLARNGIVGDFLAVRRIGGRRAFGNGQLLLVPAFRIHEKVLAAAVIVREPIAAHQDFLAVRCPIQNLIVKAAARRQFADVGVEGQALGLAAVCRDDIHLAVAAVFCGKGNPTAVG